jgi:photosystem II stability/assembly factor-like uncharacterized protein
MRLISKNLNSVLFCIALVCGSYYLMSEQNSGTSPNGDWQELSEVSNQHRIATFQIHFFDSENGLMLNAFTISKTFDKGKTWKAVSESSLSFSSLFFSDIKNGWAVGSAWEVGDTKNKNTPMILKTEDEGSHWTKVKFKENESADSDRKFNRFNDICVDKSNKFWIVGDKGIAEASFIDGDLLISKVIYSNDELYSITCTDSGEVWAVGSDSQIFHYQNGWIKQNLVSPVVFTKIRVLGDSLWLIGKSEPYPNGMLLRSNNNGKTWDNKIPNLAERYFDVYFAGNKGWLVGGNGSIYSSGNSGDSWEKEESPTKNDLLSIFALDSNNIWVTGDKGTILKYSN